MGQYFRICELFLTASEDLRVRNISQNVKSIPLFVGHVVSLWTFLVAAWTNYKREDLNLFNLPLPHVNLPLLHVNLPLLHVNLVREDG